MTDFSDNPAMADDPYVAVKRSDLTAFERDSDLASALAEAVDATPNGTSLVLRYSGWGHSVAYEGSSPGGGDKPALRITPADHEALMKLHRALGDVLPSRQVHP